MIVDGQVLMQDRQFTTLDVADIIKRIQFAFKGLLKRAGWKFSLSEPEQSMATALKLKATQRSLQIFQSLIEKEEKK